MLADTIGDHRAALVQLCYKCPLPPATSPSPEFSPAMLAAFKAPLAERMAALEAFLGTSAGDWWAEHATSSTPGAPARSSPGWTSWPGSTWTARAPWSPAAWRPARGSPGS